MIATPPLLCTVKQKGGSDNIILEDILFQQMVQ